MSGGAARWRAAAADSAAWRKIGRTTVGARLFRSTAYASADLVRRRVTAGIEAARRRQRYSTVEAFLVFIGHTKSGGSLVGAMLDAHARALVSDEIDVVRYTEAGFRRGQILALVERGSIRESMKGRVTARRLESYSLAVDGQYQGASHAPLVMGDSRAGPTTRALGDDPGKLARLRATFEGLPLRFIHVVRDPIGPMSAMMIRSGRTAENAIEDYFAQCDRLMWLVPQLGESVFRVHYEDLVADPRGLLTGICRFVGLEPTVDYLNACGTLIDGDRVSEAAQISWSPAQIDEIRRRSTAYPFLSRYVDEVGR